MEQKQNIVTNDELIPSAHNHAKPMLAEGNSIRVQRKRTKGWKMPENTVYVGRPTKFGNPFFANVYEPFSNLLVTQEIAVSRYKSWILSNENLLQVVKKELKGKNLACFCSLHKPCHADILLEIANR